MTFQPGNKFGGRHEKPFRDALRMEVALAERGEPTPAKKGSLRHAARQLLFRAGEDTAACREVADRLDGKVPQAVVGDEEHAPVRVEATNLQMAHAIYDIIQRAQIEAVNEEEQSLVAKLLKPVPTDTGGDST
jgi:hypothetical protein